LLKCIRHAAEAPRLVERFWQTSAARSTRASRALTDIEQASGRNTIRHDVMAI
jgi:hypothetical protein